MYLRNNYLSIRADIRAFEDSDDVFGHCRKCGRTVMVLPEDRRFGYCFDCLDFLHISRKTENGDGRSFALPSDNGYSLH